MNPSRSFLGALLWTCSLGACNFFSDPNQFPRAAEETVLGAGCAANESTEFGERYFEKSTFELSEIDTVGPTEIEDADLANADQCDVEVPKCAHEKPCGSAPIHFERYWAVADVGNYRFTLETRSPHVLWLAETGYVESAAMCLRPFACAGPVAGQSTLGLPDEHGMGGAISISVPDVYRSQITTALRSATILAGPIEGSGSYGEDYALLVERVD